MKRLAPVALALAAILVGTSSVLAAANKLTNLSVSPLSGSTTTTFTFSVDYSGGAATSVQAVAGSLTVTLSLCSGNSLAGTWCASRTLPVGTWPFIFHATAAGHPADPTATGPTVTVTGPTPPPTPRPSATPRPTNAPTPTGSSSQAASPAASASTSPTVGASATVPPAGSSTSNGAPSSSPAGGGLGGRGDGDKQLGRILIGGLTAIGLLAVIGFAAIWRDRRRRQAEALVLAPMQSTPTPTGLEDEPIGAIEYQTPGDEA